MMIRASHSISHLRFKLLTENLTKFQDSKHRSRTCLVSWSPSIISLQEILSIRAFAIRLSGQRNKIQLQKHSHQETDKKNWKYFIWFIVQNYLIKLLYKSTIEFTFSSIRSFEKFNTFYCRRLWILKYTCRIEVHQHQSHFEFWRIRFSSYL